MNPQSSSKPLKQHSSSLNEQNQPNNLVVLQRTDLNGSGNLNASFKASGQPKNSSKSAASR